MRRSAESVLGSNHAGPIHRNSPTPKSQKEQLRQTSINIASNIITDADGKTEGRRMPRVGSQGRFSRPSFFGKRKRNMYKADVSTVNMAISKTRYHILK